MNISLNTDYHVAVVRTTHYLSVYIDATFAGHMKMYEAFPLAEVALTGFYLGNRQDGAIGTSTFTTPVAFRGQLSDLRLYSREFTPSQLQELMAASCETETPSAVPTPTRTQTSTETGTPPKTPSAVVCSCVGGCPSRNDTVPTWSQDSAFVAWGHVVVVDSDTRSLLLRLDQVSFPLGPNRV